MENNNVWEKVPHEYKEILIEILHVAEVDHFYTNFKLNNNGKVTGYCYFIIPGSRRSIKGRTVAKLVSKLNFIEKCDSREWYDYNDIFTATDTIFDSDTFRGINTPYTMPQIERFKQLKGSDINALL